MATSLSVLLSIKVLNFSYVSFIFPFTSTLHHHALFILPLPSLETHRTSLADLLIQSAISSYILFESPSSFPLPSLLIFSDNFLVFSSFRFHHFTLYTLAFLFLLTTPRISTSKTNTCAASLSTHSAKLCNPYTTSYCSPS